MIRNIIFGTLAIILLYGLYSAFPLMSGPDIRIESPTDGAMLADGITVVRGRALRAHSITLNGAPLLMDTEGHFASTFVLPRGSSILEIAAHDRMNRTKIIHLNVFVPDTATIQ